MAPSIYVAGFKEIKASSSMKSDMLSFHTRIIKLRPCLDQGAKD
jgi:hypothetical protein